MIESPLIARLDLYITLINALNLSLWFIFYWGVITLYSFHKSKRRA